MSKIDKRLERIWDIAFSTYYAMYVGMNDTDCTDETAIRVAYEAVKVAKGRFNMLERSIFKHKG